MLQGGNLRSGCQRGQVRAVSQAVDLGPHTVEETRDLSGSFLLRHQSHSWGLLPHDPVPSQSPHRLILSLWGVRILICELGREGLIHADHSTRPGQSESLPRSVCVCLSVSLCWRKRLTPLWWQVEHCRSGWWPQKMNGTPEKIREEIGEGRTWNYSGPLFH